jgi:hypothetical protein
MLSGFRQQSSIHLFFLGGLANSAGLDSVAECAKRRNLYQILCCVRSCFQPCGTGHVLRFTPGGWAGFSGAGKNLAMAKPGKSRPDNVRPAQPTHCGVPLRPLSRKKWGVTS